MHRITRAMRAPTGAAPDAGCDSTMRPPSMHAQNPRVNTVLCRDIHTQAPLHDLVPICATPLPEGSLCWVVAQASGQSTYIHWPPAASDTTNHGKDQYYLDALLSLGQRNIAVLRGDPCSLAGAAIRHMHAPGQARASHSATQPNLPPR